MIKAVRGAVQVTADEKEQIVSQIKKMVSGMISENHIKEKNIISIFFSITSDLKSVNPAAALRRGGVFSETPLFCMQEPETHDSLPKTIRAVITADGFSAESSIVHIYLGGARKLRPDLI
jgi:chorismate mutase